MWSGACLSIFHVTLDSPGEVGCLVESIILRCLNEKLGVGSVAVGGGLGMCFKNVLNSSLLGTCDLKTDDQVLLSLLSIDGWSRMALSPSNRHVMGEECLCSNL